MTVVFDHLPDAIPFPRPDLPTFEIHMDWHDSYPVGETPPFKIKSSSEEEEPTDAGS